MKTKDLLLASFDCDSVPTDFFPEHDAEKLPPAPEGKEAEGHAAQDSGADREAGSTSPEGVCPPDGQKVADPKPLNKAPSPYEIARTLVACGYVFGKADNNLYVYDPDFGYYRLLAGENAELTIRLMTPSNLRHVLSVRIVQEIIKNLKTYPDLARGISPYDGRLARFLCFRNGVLDVIRDERLDHSDGFHFTNYVNADYPFDGSAGGKHFCKYLKDVSGGDEDIKNLIGEVLGLAISEVRGLKTAIFFYGAASSGKTTLLNVLREIIGPQFCSNISVHDLNDRYRLACLYGMKANLCGEISEEKLRRLNEFKKVTGNDLLIAERKYEHAFAFQNRALLIFAGNNLPEIEAFDPTSAFFNRMLIVPFSGSVPPSRQDLKLEAKLLSERSFIVHYAVQGLRRLMERQFQFTECKTAREIKSEYIHEQDSFRAFLTDWCSFSTGYTYSYQLQEAYLEYCRIYNRVPLSHQRCCRILESEYRVKSQKDKKTNRNGFAGLMIDKVTKLTDHGVE